MGRRTSARRALAAGLRDKQRQEQEGSNGLVCAIAEGTLQGERELERRTLLLLAAATTLWSACAFLTLGRLLGGSSDADGDDPDDDVADSLLHAVVVCARIWFLASALLGAFSVKGVLETHLPSIRFFALHAIVDTMLFGAVAVVFALTAFSASSASVSSQLGHAFCEHLSRRENGLGIITSPGSGLENCEEKWSYGVAPLVMLTACIALFVRAKTARAVWDYYRRALTEGRISLESPSASSVASSNLSHSSSSTIHAPAMHSPAAYFPYSSHSHHLPPHASTSHLPPFSTSPGAPFNPHQYYARDKESRERSSSTSRGTATSTRKKRSSTSSSSGSSHSGHTARPHSSSHHSHSHQLQQQYYGQPHVVQHQPAYSHSRSSSTSTVRPTVVSAAAAAASRIMLLPPDFDPSTKGSATSESARPFLQLTPATPSFPHSSMSRDKEKPSNGSTDSFETVRGGATATGATAHPLAPSSNTSRLPHKDSAYRGTSPPMAHARRRSVSYDAGPLSAPLSATTPRSDGKVVVYAPVLMSIEEAQSLGGREAVIAGGQGGRRPVNGSDPALLSHSFSSASASRSSANASSARHRNTSPHAHGAGSSYTPPTSTSPTAMYPHPRDQQAQYAYPAPRVAPHYPQQQLSQQQMAMYDHQQRTAASGRQHSSSVGANSGKEYAHKKKDSLDDATFHSVPLVATNSSPYSAIKGFRDNSATEMATLTSSHTKSL